MSELPDTIRVPLHELQADIQYLMGRVVAGTLAGWMVADAVAKKLALIETAAKEMIATPAAAEEALLACQDYFDSRSGLLSENDGFIPNKEMTLLSAVRAALAALSKATS
jgi:hypothetical protein